MLTKLLTKTCPPATIHPTLVLNLHDPFVTPSDILFRCLSTTTSSLTPTTTDLSQTSPSTTTKAPRTTKISSRDLPRNVTYNGKLSKPYEARFMFNRQLVHVGYFTSPSEASEATQAKRFELQENPVVSLKMRAERVLPHGVMMIKGKKGRPNTYLAFYSFNGTQKHLGYYPSPELASRAYESKMEELKSVAPKLTRDLPDGVTRKSGTGVAKFVGLFSFHGKSISTRIFMSPEEAFEALKMKRIECLADPEKALKLKPPRDLPIGISRVKSKVSNKNKINTNANAGDNANEKSNVNEDGEVNTCYRAMITYNRIKKFDEYYKTPQLAFEEINKKREELGLPVGLWNWKHTGRSKVTGGSGGGDGGEDK